MRRVFLPARIFFFAYRPREATCDFFRPPQCAGAASSQARGLLVTRFSDPTFPPPSPILPFSSPFSSLAIAPVYIMVPMSCQRHLFPIILRSLFFAVDSSLEALFHQKLTSPDPFRPNSFNVLQFVARPPFQWFSFFVGVRSQPATFVFCPASLSRRLMCFCPFLVRCPPFFPSSNGRRAHIGPPPVVPVPGFPPPLAILRSQRLYGSLSFLRRFHFPFFCSVFFL